MPNLKLVGIQNINFVNDAGELIDGVNIHFLGLDPNTLGHMGKKKFISREQLNLRYNMEKLKEAIGKEIAFEFDEKGKLLYLGV